MSPIEGRPHYLNREYVAPAHTCGRAEQREYEIKTMRGVTSSMCLYLIRINQCLTVQCMGVWIGYESVGGGGGGGMGVVVVERKGWNGAHTSLFKPECSWCKCPQSINGLFPSCLLENTFSTWIRWSKQNFAYQVSIRNCHLFF